jgi:hypothetical protein
MLIAKFQDMSPVLDNSEPSKTMKSLRTMYKEIQPLLASHMWAIQPLPQIIVGTSTYYSTTHEYGKALAVLCLSATRCDPYLHPVPFLVWRIKSCYNIAQLLSNTAPEPSLLATLVRDHSEQASLRQDEIQAIKDLDQVSLCQMLVLLILRYIPLGHSEEWELLFSAREMLEDLNALPGREKETELIRSWERDPDGEINQSFFEFAVAKPVDILAKLGMAVLAVDFGVGK